MAKANKDKTDKKYTTNIVVGKTFKEMLEAAVKPPPKKSKRKKK